jgi:hypothetical protein
MTTSEAACTQRGQPTSTSGETDDGLRPVLETKPCSGTGKAQPKLDRFVTETFLQLTQTC